MALRFTRVLAASCVLVPILAVAMTTPSAQKSDWVTRSDENALLLFDVQAKFNPEFAGRFGIQGLDKNIFQLPLDINEQNIRALDEAIVELRSRAEQETHPAILQDIDILVDAAEQQIEGMEVNSEYLLSYFDLSLAVFQGIRALLDDRTEPERRPAALVRLKRYTGIDKDYTPITEQAEAYLRSEFDENLSGPFKDDIEKDMANSVRYVAGIEQLFQKYEITDYEDAIDMWKSQLGAYEDFLRAEVLPRSREDFRLPPEVYAFNLKGVGIDMPVDELVSRAKVSFREIQNEMLTLSKLIADEHEFPSNDYRDVIRELKKKQLTGEAILVHYQQRNRDLEQLVRENGIVTLPDREMTIRLASEAESAAIPAPHMSPPRLVGNTGQMGEFVLPLRIPGNEGEDDVGFDDFTFEAASWTLTAHEGRPGHELQFASMVEKGVSQARILFAFNSVNVEGWALYSEAEMKPMMPLDGQLICLQHRLLRAARAFLDPGLQLGTISRDEAFRILENEVVVSNAMAMQEVERYTFRAPGQATSYFCGYERLMELRTDTERLLGEEFDRQAFHDFLLSQGLLPPRLMRQAVLEGFVKKEAGS